MKKRKKLMKKHFRKINGKNNPKMEELLAEDQNRVIQYAKEIISLEEGEFSAPITIVTPNTTTKRKVRFRATKLEDNFRIDYDYALFSTIFLGKRSIFLNQSTVDHLTGRITDNIATEFAYTDVVKVKTYLGYDKPENPKLSILDLTLTLVNGSDIVIPLRKHYFYENKLPNELLTEKEQYIVQTIKKAIRTIK